MDKIEIQTNKGIIQAEIVKDEKFPAIQVTVNGKIVAVVECDEKGLDGKEDIVIRSYKEKSDEPYKNYYYSTGEKLGKKV